MAPVLLPVGAQLSYPWALLLSVEIRVIQLSYRILVSSRAGLTLIMFSLWLLGWRAGQVFYCSAEVGVLDPWRQ